MIDIALVYADVEGVTQRWARSGAASRRGVGELAAAVDTAAAAVQGVTAGEAVRARFCMVTKGSHLCYETALACVAARLSAFGVTVRRLRRVDNAASSVARSLYPLAAHYFDHGPTAPALWRLLAERFDNLAFKRIFGRPYDPTLVVCGAQVMRDGGMTAEQLTEIWESGRRAVSRADLTRRYGSDAANFVLCDAEEYGWFRGPFPLGISRIAAGMTAFAMRDERVRDNEPTIVVNGHVPGLTALFGPTAWVFDLGLAADGPQIADVRRVLAGHDSRPAHCLPGTLRRDAVDGFLPLGSSAAVTSRYNLVHCSDGLVAGLAEVNALLGEDGRAADLLTGDLISAGLTPTEVERIVLADPRVLVSAASGRLSDLTRGLDLAACRAEVLRLVPPVLGPTNGYADGVDFDLLDRALQHALAVREPLPPGTHARWPLTTAVAPGPDDELAGRAALAGGAVGVLVPAGGTGGRLGGYDVREDDPARQKALVAAFTVGGRRVSSLDIRLANVRYWDGCGGGRLPMAVMGSATNEAALRRWRDGLDEPYRRSVSVFRQHPIYRIDLDLVDDNPRQTWVDVILRDATGRPSLKPSGGMGLLASFVLSGLLESWERRGVAYLALANGDDVGYRLDPRIVGHLERHPDVDCVVVGIPWRFTAVRTAGGSTRWADESGWSMDEAGRPLCEAIPVPDRKYDTGGALRTFGDAAGTRLMIVEHAGPGGALFNTNQLYLRVSAIRRAMERAGAGDPVVALQRMTKRQGVLLEDKTVLLDGVPRRARQISQPVHGVLAWIDRCDVVTGSRQARPDVRGTYAPLKHPIDVRFAALMLERSQREANELAFGERLIPVAEE